MTQKDKDEIRQIIREELNAKTAIVFNAGIQCQHTMIYDYNSTVPYGRCSKCGFVYYGYPLATPSGL